MKFKSLDFLVFVLIWGWTNPAPALESQECYHCKNRNSGYMYVPCVCIMGNTSPIRSRYFYAIQPYYRYAEAIEIENQKGHRPAEIQDEKPVYIPDLLELRRLECDRFYR